MHSYIHCNIQTISYCQRQDLLTTDDDDYQQRQVLDQLRLIESASEVIRMREVLSQAKEMKEVEELDKEMER